MNLTPFSNNSAIEQMTKTLLEQLASLPISDPEKESYLTKLDQELKIVFLEKIISTSSPENRASFLSLIRSSDPQSFYDTLEKEINRTDPSSFEELLANFLNSQLKKLKEKYGH